jgi:Winged helix-turn helix
MPKLVHARPPQDAAEERQVRQRAGSRHAPADGIRRARMIVRSWDGLRTPQIATALGVHPATVREQLPRLNADGLEGLGDRPGGGRKPRLTAAERRALIGRVPPADGPLAPAGAADGDASEGSRDARAAGAPAPGLPVGRRPLPRLRRRAGVRGRRPPAWGPSPDQDCAPPGRRSSPAPPTPRRRRRPAGSLHWAR